MKKVLSLVLVLTLVLGSFSFAFAFDDVAEQDCEKAVNTLVALGVVNGYDDGTFRPEKTVTRAQIAKMLVVALGYEDLITGTTSSFTDCAGHWADSYIAFAAGQKIVNGYPDGTFKPDATVSYDEAITMIIRALGYTDDALAGTWPTNYKIKALDLDITKDVKLTNGGADRGGVAMLIYNALEAELITVNADNEVVKETPKKVLLDRIGNLVPELKVTPSILDKDSADYQLSDVDLSAYMYETLKVYTIENEDNDAVVVYVSDAVTDTIVGEIDSVDENNIVIKEADDDEYTFSTSDVSFYLNGAEVVGTDIAAIETAVETNKLTATIKAVFEADEDGTYVVKNKMVQNPVGMVVTLATNAVQIDNEYDKDDFDIDGIKLPVTTNDEDDQIVDFDNLKIVGDATSLEDIKEDDVVTVYAADVKDGEKYPQAVKLFVSRNTVEGKVTKVKDSNSVVVSGTAYDTSDYTGYSDYKAISLGDEGIFYLDDNGEIFAWEGESSELTNYAVVIGTDAGTTSEAFNTKAVDKYAQIKLAKADGETVVFDLYSKFEDDAFKGFEMTLANGDTAQAVTAADGNITPYNFADGALVLYDVNSDDQIDELTIVDTTNGVTTAELKGSNLDSQYRITDDTIIFDGTGSEPDYDVLDLSDLDETITAKVVEDAEGSFGALKVLIVTVGAEVAEDGNYAVILDVNEALNSDDDAVQELSVLLDGVEKTYLSDTNSSSNDAYITTEMSDNFYFNLLNLEISTNDVVTKVDTVVSGSGIEVYGDAPKAANAVTVAAIDADAKLVRIDTTNYEIADNAVVYVATYDHDATTKWTVEAGDLNDIDKEDYVKVYDLDASEDDGFEIIIVFDGDIDEL